MFDPKDVGGTFSKAARAYDEHAELQQVIREETISMAQGFWKAGAHLLDLGCGTGAFSKEIRQAGHDWQVTQADLAEGMCKVAQEQNPVACASALALPFADGSFDGVFSSLMLQWVYDPLPVMREIARVTRPGGVCVISTLVQGTLQELRESFASLDDGLHVNYFADPAPLTALCVHGGYRLLACEEETLTVRYATVLELMRSIKAIGASSTQSARKSGMMTPRKLARLEQFYREKFGPRKGKKKELPATWQVLYMVLERT